MVWVINLACTKPKDHGLAAELWSYRALTEYTRQHAPDAGYPCLAKAVKATIWRILSENEIQPHKIKYYLERRYPDFARKMQDVLMVYQEVNMQNDSSSGGDIHPSVITVSVYEKLGVQAIATVALDLPPKLGRHKSVGWDHEYKRLFVYVHTPKHGSWLNLIETAFSKMARTLLRHIRVSSKEELKQCILKGIAEINASPVVYRWKKFDLGLA